MSYYNTANIPTVSTSAASGKRHRLPRLVLVGVLMLNLLVVGILARNMYVAMWRERGFAEINVRNLGETLEDGLTATVEKIDLTLLALRDDIERQIAEGGINPAAAAALLDRHNARIPETFSLRLVAADGTVLRFGADEAASPANIGDRPFFARLRDTPAAGLIISDPVLGQTSGVWSLILCRRLNRPDGSFAGAVILLLPLEYFSRRMAELALGPHGAISLWNDTPTLLVRVSGESGARKEPGGVAPSPELAELIAGGTKAATYFAKSGADGVTRIFSFLTLEQFHLFLTVGIAEQDYLADWRREFWQTGWVTLLFMLAGATAGWAIHRGWRHQQRDNQALAEAYDLAVAAMTRSNSILASAGEGICGIDASGAITFINPAARAMLGWDEHEGIGDDLHGRVHHRHTDGADYPEENCPSLATLRDGRSRQVGEDVYWRKDGTAFPVSYTTAAIFRDREIVGAVNVFQNISQRRAMEDQLKAANRELEQFAYVASHDLRHPLRMVTSYLTLIAQKLGAGADDELRSWLSHAANGARNMDRLICDLLEYSRTGRDGGDWETVALAELLPDVLLILSAGIADAGATVELAGHLPTVLGNRSELTRLFQNLINNAVKYRHPERSPVIGIGYRQDGPNSVVWVRDNGTGIPAKQRDRVFAIFQRLVPKDEIEGTGIGLAVCKKIVEHHGGRIWIEDTPGGGATFLVAFPQSENLPRLTTNPPEKL